LRTIDDVAKAISGGGGVFAKALIIGPRQERWLRLLETVDRREVENAVRSIVSNAVSPANACYYLNIGQAFLGRYDLEVTRKRPGTLYPVYQPPTTVAGALPIVRARVEAVGKGGLGTGAWRVEDLMNDPNPRVRKAAIGALKVVLADCKTIGEVASAFGVTRMFIWKWRKQWPDFDKLVAPLRSDRKPKQGKVKLRTRAGRRLTLEEAIDLMAPHLPGKAKEVGAKIAANVGEAGHEVVPTARQLSHYVEKVDSRGLMVARWRDRRGKKIAKVWALVDTKTGKRVDQKEAAR